MRGWTVAVFLAVTAAGTAAEDPARQPVLPPEQPWSGRSRELLVPPADPWATPAEKEGLLRTPRYDETVAWLRRLVAAAPELRLVSLGRSPEGRDLWMVVASREKAFTPETLRATGKPVVLAQGGIHAGEIDGKDAGLMLLRDMMVRGTRRDLLDGASFLFVPVFNVDGHERFSAFTRINQRGPAEAGWRTTASNLNLNRDYSKLDAPEMRAMVGALRAWDPDLYLDLHVTDGIDHQYDITFGHNAGSGWSPAIHDWLQGAYAPAVAADLRRMGHVPGPLAAANAVDPLDLDKGIAEWVAGPRLSTGYGDVRHVPTVLVENHSLKPYPQRVFGTYVLLESTLRIAAREWPRLRAAIAEDRARRAPSLPLTFAPGKETPETVEYLGVGWRVESSAVSGGKRVVWTGEPRTLRLPVLRFRPALAASRPKAYLVPPAWGDVLERLALHGIRMEPLREGAEMEVEMLRITEAKLASQPFEGRVGVEGAAFASERRRERFPAGTMRVSTDQPLGDLAVVLLDPRSPDSFFQWGFFHEVLQPTEYVEAYVMEPTAERMLAADPKLRAELEAAVRQSAALASPEERLQWLFRRTPFFDERWRVYPVALVN